ncbi:MAG TPA: hypothetical protein VM345_15430 [Acidimicrobiales bacterium]|nr:hypothetical protein [Acidimicrobiales bacterium]
MRLQPRIHMLPFEQSRRSARRGAWLGAAIGLVAFLGFAVTGGLESVRSALGVFIMLLSMGAATGSAILVKPYNSFTDAELPESKRRLMLLIAVITAGGFGGTLIGAYVAGIAGG